ncbi:hypothetical protein QAD02_001192 [Eretmocerus hayati]|uniref:Uncharacterized protein n=1 Tax=Eretmocerus hayati TaxID=131215 RepID=A0ACC2NGK7_9HYME|nr:hypothetical protein QAD02_001192 [Eretmocerus hayati]
MTRVSSYHQGLLDYTRLKIAIIVMIVLFDVPWLSKSKINNAHGLPLPNEIYSDKEDELSEKITKSSMETEFKSPRTKRSLLDKVPLLTRMIKKCPEGFDLLGDGSCVKNIKINKEAYMEFLTAYLNREFGSKVEKEKRDVAPKKRGTKKRQEETKNSERKKRKKISSTTYSPTVIA